MPMYEYKCAVCGVKHTAVRTVATRDMSPMHNCDGNLIDLTRVVFPHQFIAPDIAPYRAMGPGTPWITSRSEHREHLYKHGYEEVGNDSSWAPPPDEEPHPHTRAKAVEAQITKEIADAERTLATVGV